MNNRISMAPVMARRVLLLVAIFAALTPLSLYLVSVTRAQTGTSAGLAAPALTATASGATAIDLNWPSISGAARYDLRVWWAGAAGWQPLELGSPTDTSFSHTGLTPGRRYVYIVAAVDSNGQLSAWSQQEVTLPDSEATLSPPTLNAEAGPGQITLTWESVANADSYVLIYYDGAISDWVRIGGVLTGTSYIHTGRLTGTTYYYLIQSVTGTGAASAWSEYGIATVTETSAATATPTPTPLVTSTPTQTPTPTPTPTADDSSETTVAEERAALVAFFNATDGANWTNHHNWLTDEPLATWYGVTTDGSGHVTELRLPDNRLSGSIPDLSALTNLTTLYLYQNQLAGQIPALRTLTNLTHLALNNNRLSGPIPDLSALTNLTALYLYQNQLTGLIPDLRALTNLTILALNHNQLTGPIPDLSALTNLTELVLTGNDLCLPAGASLSHSNSAVAAHLQSLILPSCTDVTPTPTLTPAPTLTPTPLLTSTPTQTPTSTQTPTQTPTPTVSAPSRPVLIADVAGPTAVDLSWTTVHGAVRYVLWTRWDLAIGWQQLDDGTLSETSYPHTGLSPGTTYEYAVRAIDANGLPLGPWSNYPKATLPESDAPTPTPTPTPTLTLTPTLNADTDTNAYAYTDANADIDRRRKECGRGKVGPGDAL